MKVTRGMAASGQAALEFYRQVLDIAKDGDNERPEIKRARSFTN